MYCKCLGKFIWLKIEEKTLLHMTFKMFMLVCKMQRHVSVSMAMYNEGAQRFVCVYI